MLLYTGLSLFVVFFEGGGDSEDLCNSYANNLYLNSFLCGMKVQTPIERPLL